MNNNYGYSEGVNIQLKVSPNKYMGPSQLGYQPQNIPQSPTYKQKTGIKQFFFPSKTQSQQVIFSNVAIVSKKANKVLDVCQDNDRKGMLIIYEDFKQPNQRFDIVKCGDYVNIVNRQNGKLLTVEGNSEKNGAPIFEEPTHDLVGQRFRLAQTQNNQYLIHTFCGKVLDCCQEKTANGTIVIQWKCDRKDHQKWLIRS